MPVDACAKRRTVSPAASARCIRARTTAEISRRRQAQGQGRAHHRRRQRHRPRRRGRHGARGRRDRHRLSRGTQGRQRDRATWSSTRAAEALLLAGDVGDEDVLRGGGRARRSSSSAASTFWSTTPPSSTRPRTSASIDAAQIERTFRTNVFSFFFMTKHALRHMKKGGASSTPPRSPPIRATRRCSIIPPPRAPSSP